MGVNNNLVKQTARTTFSAWMANDSRRSNINAVVGQNSQRFITAIISAVSNNEALKECSFESILSAALLGEGLKLSPSPQLGQYYMVPYNDKNKGKVAQFQLGYKGYIQLAIRSGYYKKINVVAIKEGELIKYDPLAEEISVNLIENDEERENKPTIGYYAMFEYQNGFIKAMYWSRAKMEAHADKYSKAFSLDAYRKVQAGKIPQGDMWKYSSYWYADFDGMAFKTMLRQLISKWGIMSIELQKAYESDDGVVSENGTVEFVEDEPTVVVAETPEAEPEPEAEAPAEAKESFFS